MADSFPTRTVFSVCSGIDGLCLGVCAGLEHLGFSPRVLGYCERDAFAASILLARMEESALEPAPVYAGCISELDATGLRGMVDVLCAGVPCQPYSAAGKRVGNSDERSWGRAVECGERPHRGSTRLVADERLTGTSPQSDSAAPLPHVLRIVSECRPAVVFLECVPPWVRGGWFRPFGEELCRLGYALEQPLFVTAESVGASHRRERVFVMAITPRGGFGELWEPSRSDGQLDGSDKSLDNADSTRPTQALGRSDERQTGQSSGECLSGDGLGTVDHSKRDGRRKRKPRRRQDQGTVAVFAPGPADPRWAAILKAAPHLAPAVEPSFRLLADGDAVVVDESRADQLRCIGNACVPLQASVAFCHLLVGTGLL